MAYSIQDYKTLFEGDEKNYPVETHLLVYKWGIAAIEAFRSSERGKNISKGDSKCLYLIGVFAELAYSYFLAKPGQWKATDVERICYLLMSHSQRASRRNVNRIRRILKSFFLWGEEVGIFPDTSAWREALANRRNAFLIIDDDIAFPSNKSCLQMKS